MHFSRPFFLVPLCGLLRLLFAVVFAILAHPANAKFVVTYPKQESANGYPAQVLRLALQEAGADFKLQPSDTPMPQGRALQQLAAGENVNLVWSMTSKERELKLRPIRIPIDKGLLGWRLFLINKTNAATFARVKTLDDLRKLQAGQGHDWPDTDILRQNGLTVQGSASYEGLFKMLRAQRFDYFPRSIIEIWNEQKAYGGTEFEIEKTLLLHYPTALYFFVNKNDRALAKAIEIGLNTAIQNGKFDQLFQQTYGDVLQRAHVHTRTKLQLTNPLLPLATPLERKELWIQF
jgi:ABC-type amino acid transport substrate-binding protein